MAIFNYRTVRTASILFVILSSLTFQACQDHRLPPMQAELPDQIFYALTDNNTIYELNVRNTATPIRTLTITEGLEANDVLVGIDFRPATGQLFAVSKNSRLYNINLSAAVKPGLATVIGSAAFGPMITATGIGFDFNPTVDRIRFVTNTGQNLRLHPETGAVAMADGNLNGVPSIMVGAVAYTNSFSGTATTALYDIDPAADRLYLQSNPNGGGLQDVGPLGLDITDVGGFDITPTKTMDGKEYAIASVLVEGKWELDFVDLASGKLQKLGLLPAGKIIGIAIPTPVAYATTTDNKLIIFNPLTPSSTVQRTISGLPMGVTIEGIDFRPANATLYALGSDSKVYTLNTLTGLASLVFSLSLPLDGESFGVDFNPFADRLRVVSNTGQNLRIDVSTGLPTVVATVDGTLNVLPSTTPVTPKGVNGAAYTNSFVGLSAGTQTVLYDIDSQTDKLFRQDPPNTGGLVELGSLGIDIDKSNGFDIGGVSQKGYGLFTVGGVTSLYSVNIGTGSATMVGSFSSPVAGVKGFALGFNL
jgi:WD40 repeat protein